jgi:serine/threonine-protein kinase HipA
MEDFAQALELRPEAKYDGSYAAIGLALQRASTAPEQDLLELLRRIKVNELLGNFDAHTKNFSLLYRADGDVRLSPAYDIVAYAAYLDGKGHALKFYPDQKARADLAPAVLRQLANTWELPETRLKDVVAYTVDQAMRTWPALIRESILLAGQKQRLLDHLEKNPSVIAWGRRHPG